MRIDRTSRGRQRGAAGSMVGPQDDGRETTWIMRRSPQGGSAPRRTGVPPEAVARGRQGGWFFGVLDRPACGWRENRGNMAGVAAA